MLEKWKEELLCSLLWCGERDLDVLGELFEMCKKFGIEIRDVVEDSLEGGAIDNVNDLIFSAMSLILRKIADIAEGMGEAEVADQLREWDIYVNASDSHFNIDILDGGMNAIRDMTLEEIARKVVEEVKSDE
jgi:hypothetical protein